MCEEQHSSHPTPTPGFLSVLYKLTRLRHWSSAAQNRPCPWPVMLLPFLFRTLATVDGHAVSAQSVRATLLQLRKSPFLRCKSPWVRNQKARVLVPLQSGMCHLKCPGLQFCRKISCRCPCSGGRSYLSKVTSQKTIDLPSSGSHPQPIAPQLGVGLHKALLHPVSLVLLLPTRCRI